MVPGLEVAESILQRQPLLFLCKYVLAPGRVVDCIIVWLRLRQLLRDARQYLPGEFGT